MSIFSSIFKRKKRKDQRFILDEYELIIYNPNAPEEREIVDLSLGGIGFTYLDTGKRLDESFELEIKIGDDFHLRKVRVKTVSDTEVSRITSKKKSYRRLNARFLNLDPIQEYDLKSILNKYGKKI